MRCQLPNVRFSTVFKMSNVVVPFFSNGNHWFNCILYHRLVPFLPACFPACNLYLSIRPFISFELYLSVSRGDLETTSWKTSLTAKNAMTASNVNNYSGEAVVVSIIFVLLAAIFVGARFFVRFGILQAAGADDWIILASLVSGSAFSCTSVVSQGYPQTSVSQAFPVQTIVAYLTTRCSSSLSQ